MGVSFQIFISIKSARELDFIETMSHSLKTARRAAQSSVSGTLRGIHKSFSFGIFDALASAERFVSCQINSTIFQAISNHFTARNLPSAAFLAKSFTDSPTFFKLDQDKVRFSVFRSVFTFSFLVTVHWN